MAFINKQDTNGTKGTLAKGELGYDDYTAGGDAGRVYVGDGTTNIALAKQSEVVASALLTAIKTVDGASSGLDADLLDGIQASSFLRSDTTDTATGALTFSAAGNKFTYGNTTYGTGTGISLELGADTTPGALKVQGSISGGYGLIQGTTDNLHLDCVGGNTYLNYYDGNAVVFGSGASTIVASMDSAGQLWQGSTIGSGNRYWNSSNDGSGSGLDADLLDGLQPSALSVLSASQLTTARTIGGVSFNGTANINLPGVNTTGNQNTTGSSATLTTARTISLSGDATGSISFDGSANVTIPVVIADDSHNHVISNVDGLQTALDGKLATTGKAANSDLLDGIDSSQFLRSDTTDTFTSLSGTSLTIGAGATLTGSADRADLLKITSSTAGWGGIQISNTSNEFLWSFMVDGTIGGIYDDLSNAWHIKFIDGGASILFHAGTQKLTTTTTGVSVSGTIVESSDSRLKENIKPLEGALDKVSKLNGVSYNRIGSDLNEIGFIAQDVENVVPEFVTTNEEGMKAVSYARTVALLVEAIKEQQEEINKLKIEINNLKGAN